MFGATVAIVGCEEKQAAAPEAPPPPAVTVVSLRQQPVTITTELPGRTSAFQTAEVRPQVGGVIRERLFTEGAEVQAGQPLYQIDPAPYQAQLDSAEAALRRNEAAAASAAVTVNRYRPLVRARAVSQQDLDLAEAALRQAQADVASGRAAVETARINLDYTRVTSPIAGRTGRSAVTAGALVTSQQTASLVTITQLDPIYVDVTQSAARVMRLRRDLAEGTLRQDGEGQAVVHLTLEDGTEYPEAGRLQFSEVIVDPGTGSITLRAVFPNPNGQLMPGLFVRARIEEGVTDRALMVPQQAVTRTPRGEATAMVVDAEGTVAARIIKAERAIGTAWLVTEGLSEGDRVIVEGIQRARPGGKVNATETTQQALNERGAAAASASASANAAPAAGR
ncbi:efflux RND transporter periplasmic adaptor subunit [Roseococcus sp. SYP-B2431]|uniref:efflux RND transporter periplasmic adaptor subunit n=1 Tax=Roseococcus sp. SYP-B2431 TaxID=2496640 RepID=UPI0010406E83|nr:efflux RND transporter periplasmic adaptor subunit [Roseococcus sp. SYP-B2431]TCH99649.1 efflux RND transporter periplasmic adaptor subunit [Roseococcus sp. SYP-B2431]